MAATQEKNVRTEAELLGKQAPEVMRARTRRREDEARGQEKLARQHAAYEARVDAEADRQEEAERRLAAIPPLDPVTALAARLNTERDVREKLSRGEYERLAPFEMIFRQDVKRCLRERAEARTTEHEAQLGLPTAIATWQRGREAIGDNASRERARAEQDHSAALRAIAEREEVELEKLGPQPSTQTLEAQKLTTTAPEE